MGGFSLQELRDQVGNTVASGINLTGEIVRAGVPLARAAIEQAPAIINGTRAALQAVNSDENRERVSQIAGVGTRVAQSAQRVASGTPELVSQGTRLVGSIIHAANDTAPLIVDGIQEFTDQIPLITGFASAYAEVNAEQTQKVQKQTTMKMILHICWSLLCFVGSTNILYFTAVWSPVQRSRRWWSQGGVWGSVLQGEGGRWWWLLWCLGNGY